MQKKLYDLFATEYKNSEKPETNYLFDEYKALKILNYNIKDKSCDVFCKWLHFLYNIYDTPYGLHDFVLISYGTNLTDETNDFRECFSCAHYSTVETWI